MLIIQYILQRVQVVYNIKYDNVRMLFLFSLGAVMLAFPDEHKTLVYNQVRH